MTDAGLVVVDKPAGVTSHDVVGRCRRIFGTRKVGHAGTLDPMATGVLVVGIERATKILGLLTRPTSRMRRPCDWARPRRPRTLKAKSCSLFRLHDVTDAQIDEAVAALRGEIAQVPSAVSAVKVGGQRAYKLAREGQAVELAPRNVRIDRFDVLAIRRHDGLVDVDVEVDCSSGTYIRALARDVGAALGVGGHLTALRRTRVGRFGLDQARTLDDLAEQPRLSYSLDEACLQSFPRRDLSPAEAEDTRHGRPLKPAGIEGVYAATAPDGRVIALLTDGATRTKPVVVLRPATLDSV